MRNYHVFKNNNIANYVTVQHQIYLINIAYKKYKNTTHWIMVVLNHIEIK